jgi:hypothetical protein
VPAKKGSSKGSIWNYKASTFSPYGQRGLILGQFFVALFEFIKSGFSPGRGDSKEWYARAFKVIGGLIVISCLFYGLVLNFIDRAHGRR